MQKALLLFQSTHAVIRAERLCLEHGVAVQVIPVPREISSECGMALEIREDQVEAAVALLERQDIRAAVHRRP